MLFWLLPVAEADGCTFLEQEIVIRQARAEKNRSGFFILEYSVLSIAYCVMSIGY